MQELVTLKGNDVFTDSLIISYQELARLNQMIGIALMSGKVEFDAVSESIHQKVTREIYEKNAFPDKSLDYLFQTDEEV